MPLPSGPLRGYEPNLRLPVPSDCLRSDPIHNPKLVAISAHTSQTGGSPSSYLFGFARREEVFFSEQLVRDASGNWVTNFEPHAEETLTVELRGHERFRVEQRLPPAVGMSLARPAPGQPIRVTLFELGRTRYLVDFDGRALQVTLSKQTALGIEPLQEWPLPHDTWATPERAEHFELQLTPDSSDPSASALRLLRAGELVGVAIDPDPPRRGHALGVDEPGGAGEGVSFSISAAGSGGRHRR